MAKGFRKNASASSTEKRLFAIAQEILKNGKEALISEPYQTLIARQNVSLNDLFQNSDEPDITPAAGLNYSALTNRILYIMEERFGEHFCIARKQPVPGKTPRSISTLYPIERLSIFDRNPGIPDSRYTTFLPADISNTIREWLKSDDTIMAFIKRLNAETLTFSRNLDVQRRFILLDMFFTALEKRLDKLPKEKRLDVDFSNSIYINPEFIINEISTMLPFYKYDSQDFEHIDFGRDRTSKVKIPEKEDVASTFAEAAYPLQESTDGMKLSRLLTEAISESRVNSTPAKIIKAFYPLYLFLFNNIVAHRYYDPQASISRIKGCKLSNPNWNLNPIIDALKIRIKHYTYNKDYSDIDKQNAAVQLYALRQFDRYMDNLYEEMFIEKKRGGNFDSKPHFLYNYARKKGNSSSQQKHEGIVTCDFTLTTWLFIRYSDMFRIALMPEVEELYGQKSNPSLLHHPFPQNFFTAFNFNKNALKIYPTFQREYTAFINAEAEKIYMRFRELAVDKWMKIAHYIESSIDPSFHAEWDALHQTLESFFEKIHFSKPNLSDNPYSYDQNEFIRYFRMYSKWERALPK